jgi:hypothetical protein
MNRSWRSASVSLGVFDQPTKDRASRLAPFDHTPKQPHAVRQRQRPQPGWPGFTPLDLAPGGQRQQPGGQASRLSTSRQTASAHNRAAGLHAPRPRARRPATSDPRPGGQRPQPGRSGFTPRDLAPDGDQAASARLASLDLAPGGQRPAVTIQAHAYFRSMRTRSRYTILANASNCGDIKQLASPLKLSSQLFMPKHQQQTVK